MKRDKQLVLAGFTALLLISGCAKDGVVTKDDAMAPSTQPAATAPAPAPAKAADPGAANLKAGLNATQQSSLASDGSTGSGNSTAKDTGKSSAATGKGAPDVTPASFSAIYFDFDSHLLSEQSRSSLATLAETLKKQKSAKIKIEGNCDERGSDEYNLALGERRAQSAATYLITLGIDKDRLSTISYGKEKPQVQGHDEAAWAKNRRDDFVPVK